MRTNMRMLATALVLLFAGAPVVLCAEPIEIGSRRELFVDHRLIDTLDDTTLRMHRPIDRGPVLSFDKPWEGRFAAYVTIIHRAADGKYQAYYRGSSGTSMGNIGDHQVVCYAESSDGINWTKPALDLFPRDGHAKTNIVLADAAPDTTNFSPFYDTRRGVKPEERYKAIGGYHKEGLRAYVSADGIRWRRLSDEPVLTNEQVGFTGKFQADNLVFDSQNVPFWSEHEQKYLLYYRVYRDRKRRIARVESDDFINWRNPTLMEYQRAPGEGDAAIEQLYTNQTHPYFRAPHLYVATAARFMLKRRALTTQQAESTQVNPRFYNDTSDAVLLTTRGGNVYDRTFMEAFIAPGIGYENWTSRTNYPALGVVQTGRDEMSVYVNQNYGQPTAHLRRYSMRLDGFASLHADFDGGEMITKPLTFAGAKLHLNYATSAAGGIRVEVQDAGGNPVPGFTLDDCQEIIGNEVERAVEWTAGRDVGTLAGKPVRLRFSLKDADVFALRFGDPAEVASGSPRVPLPETAGVAAASDYTQPVAPGGVNGRPFWNTYSRRFVYAPAFDLPAVQGAAAYRFTTRDESGQTRRFTADEPSAPLSPIWNDLPEGYITLAVEGVNSSGGVVGRSGERAFYRSPGFSTVQNAAPAASYFDAGRAGLRAIYEAKHVQYWLEHGKPDPTYRLYCYPSKVMGGLMRAMVAYARVAESPDDRERALRLARSVADHLISISVSDEHALAGFPPTYAVNVDEPFNQAKEGAAGRKLMIPSAADTALGYLDLYDATKDQAYLNAVKQIVETYERTQGTDGTWPLVADHMTGEALAPQRTVPTWIIWLLDRVARDHGIAEHAAVRQRAWDWIAQNPRRTYQWDGQFEDVKPKPAYANLSREQACDVAVMLLANADGQPQRVAEAEELLRFAEDQFIVWSPVKSPEGWRKLYRNRKVEEWMPPCVLEQYSVYAPVARSSAVVINAYLAAHRATGKAEYLDRAKALANGLLNGQKWLAEHHNGNGEFATWLMLQDKPLNWLNNSYYAAEAVLAVAAAQGGGETSAQ